MVNERGKWVLVTGANGGIGQAVCKCFKEAGYSVIGTDLSEKAAATWLDGWINCDLITLVNDESYSLDTLSQVNSITDDVGLTALINNAALQIKGNLSEISRPDWFNTMAVNLSAPFFLSQLFLASLEANRGSIVNVGSIHAVQTKREFISYATSKGALATLSKAMAVDLGGSVRVNAVAPAAVETDMLAAGFESVDDMSRLADFHPIGRIAAVKEVAEAVLFLCSDAAAFIHGACLNVTGGIDNCLHDPCN